MTQRWENRIKDDLGGPPILGNLYIEYMGLLYLDIYIYIYIYVYIHIYITFLTKDLKISELSLGELYDNIRFGCL